jgi:hypothetical protein
MVALGRKSLETSSEYKSSLALNQSHLYDDSAIRELKLQQCLSKNTSFAATPGLVREE